MARAPILGEAMVWYPLEIAPAGSGWPTTRQVDVGLRYFPGTGKTNQIGFNREFTLSERFGKVPSIGF